MRIQDHPTLQRQQLDARVKQLQARGPVLAASLVQIARRCGRPGCHCTRGELHVGHYLTRSVAGKTQTVYVPVDLVDEVRAWIGEYQRLRQLIRESSQLALAQVRGHVTARKRRAGRPSGR
jgi:hypothetical protein